MEQSTVKYRDDLHKNNSTRYDVVYHYWLVLSVPHGKLQLQNVLIGDTSLLLIMDTICQEKSQASGHLQGNIVLVWPSSLGYALVIIFIFRAKRKMWSGWDIIGALFITLGPGVEIIESCVWLCISLYGWCPVVRYTREDTPVCPVCGGPGDTGPLARHHWWRQPGESWMYNSNNFSSHFCSSVCVPAPAGTRDQRNASQRGCGDHVLDPMQGSPSSLLSCYNWMV